MDDVGFRQHENPFVFQICQGFHLGGFSGVDTLLFGRVAYEKVIGWIRDNDAARVGFVAGFGGDEGRA